MVHLILFLLTLCVHMPLVSAAQSAPIAEQQPEQQEGYFEPDEPLIELTPEQTAENQKQEATQNAQGLQTFETMPQEVLTLAPANPADTYKPITPEESARIVSEKEKEKLAKQQEALQKEAEKTAEAKQREDLFSYNLTGLKEAGVDVTKNGFGLTGKIMLIGNQYARLTFAINTDGLLAQGYLNELNLFNMFKITGVGPDKKRGTADDGVLVELKISKDIQRVRVNGIAELFGASGEIDLTYGVDIISYMLKIDILKMFQTIFLAEFKPTDPDILLAAAIDINLTKYLEQIGSEALGQLGHYLTKGSEEAQKDVDVALGKVKALEKQCDALKEKYKAAEAKYTAFKNTIQKPIEDAERDVLSAQESCRKELKKIMAAREKVLAGKRKISSAQDKVNSISSTVDNAKEELRKAKRKAGWTQPWMYAVVAYWGAQVGILEAARNVALGVLEAAKFTIAPVAEILTGTYQVSYLAARSGLMTAYSALYVAKQAAYPIASPLYGEALGIGIELAGVEIAYRAAQGSLYTAYGALEVSKQAGKGISAVGDNVIGALLGGIFNIDGGGFKCQLSELIKGKLDLYLIARVFGLRKNLKIAVDIAHPDKFASSFAKSLVTLINPVDHGGSSSIFDDIEASREKFSGDLRRLEQETKEQEDKRSVLEKQLEEHKLAAEKLKTEYDQNVANANQEFSFSADELKELGDLNFAKEKLRISTVDENNPTSYIAANMANTFRWLEKWKFATPDHGAIVFDVIADADVEIGLHNSFEAYHAVGEDKDSEKKEVVDTVLDDLASGDEKDATRPHHIFDIIIGAEKNSTTVIRNSKNYILAQNNSADALLDVKAFDAQKPQSFWVSYNKGHISCGKGNKPGEQTIIEWFEEKAPDNIVYFSFSCKEGKASYNNIATTPESKKPFGSLYCLKEKYQQFYWHSPFMLPEKGKGTITFAAQATDTICIGLTDDPGKTTPQYIAIIGGESNTISTIGKVSDNGKEYQFFAVSKDPVVLVPTKTPPPFKTYWVTIDGAALAWGTGDDPTKNIALEMNDDMQKHIPKFFSFSCWDNQVIIKDIATQKAQPLAIGSKYSAVNKKFAFTWKEAWRLPSAGSGTITWQAKGEQDMAIGLAVAPTPESQTPADYTCIIGAEKNTQLQIKDKTGKIIASSTDPASCIQEKSRYNNYWLTYDKGHIALGSNTPPGENPVLEYKDTESPITHFSFSNNTGFIEYQLIASQNAVATTINQAAQTRASVISQSAYEWSDDAKLVDEDTCTLLYNAKADNNLMFGWGKKDATTPAYEVIIGADNNTRTVIRKNNQIVAESRDPAALIAPDGNFHAGWVNLYKGHICVGTGDVVGQSIVLEWVDPEPQRGLTHYAHTTKQSPILMQSLTTQAGVKLPIATTYSAVNQQNNPSWLEPWRLANAEKGIITFALAATHEGICALTSKPDRGAVYTISIGKTISFEKFGKELRSIKNPQPPRIDNPQAYWIIYDKGYLSLGTGSTPSKETRLLEYQDTAVIDVIQRFGFTNAKGQTTFQAIASVAYTPLAQQDTNTTFLANARNKTYQFVEFWKLREANTGTITFKAQGKASYRIGFSRDLSAQTTDPLYEVVIGGAKNTQLEIRCKGQVRETSTLPEGTVLLPNDPTDYWISINKDTIIVGVGEPGIRTLASWKDITPLTDDKPLYFSFSSDTSTVTYSDIASIPLIKPQRGNEFASPDRQGKYKFDSQWRWNAANPGALLFSIRGEKNAMIGLQTESSPLPLYEVIIGAEGNTATLIKYKGAIVARAQGSDATIANKYLASSYWINHDNGRIAVGQGTTIGEKTIIAWAGDATAKPTPVTYFLFSADGAPVRFSDFSAVPGTAWPLNRYYRVENKKDAFEFREQWRFTDKVLCSFEATAPDGGMVLGLATTPYDVPYTIVLGGWKNTQSAIMKNGIIVASLKEPIKTDKKPYWIAYAANRIIVGKGTPGSDQSTLLDWTDADTAKPLSYLSFSSRDGVVTYENIMLD